MSTTKGIVTRASIQGIADGIRYANGSSTEYLPGEMEAAVRALKKTLVSKTATANGTYAPEDDNADGYSEFVVDVQGGGAVVQPLSVTQNGTYNPPSGVDGYAPVTVNVSGGDDWSSLKSYIQSSGTQYIDTGYLPNDNTNVEIIASVSRGNNLYPTIFGMRPQAYSSAGSHDFLIHFYSDTDRGTLFEWNTGVAILPFLNLADKKTRYKFGANWYSVENDVYMMGNSTQPSGSINGIYPLYIFNFNNIGSVFGSGGACLMKLYRFRIYEGDTLIHEFIPWQENGVACLKDTITENLKYNAGTGDFVYGTDA